MFDLDKAIAQWRRRLIARGIKAAEVLDELESHLREEAERNVRAGLQPQAAFQDAIEQLGDDGALQGEFAKLDQKHWLLRRRLKAACCFLVAGCMALGGAYALDNSDFVVGVRTIWMAALLSGLLAVWVFRDTILPSNWLPNTAVANHAVAMAWTEALGFHHDFIGTEHMLLGLLTDENGTVTNLLRKMRVTPETIRAEIKNVVGLGLAGTPSRFPPQTPRLKRALGLAAREAKALGQDHVGPEHILLGLVSEGDGVAARVLNDVGIKIRELRTEVIRENKAGAVQ